MQPGHRSHATCHEPAWIALCSAASQERTCTVTIAPVVTSAEVTKRNERRRRRRRAVLGALGLALLGLASLWFAVHRIPSLGPWLAGCAVAPPECQRSRRDTEVSPRERRSDERQARGSRGRRLGRRARRAPPGASVAHGQDAAAPGRAARVGRALRRGDRSRANHPAARRGDGRPRGDDHGRQDRASRAAGAPAGAPLSAGAWDAAQLDVNWSYPKFLVFGTDASGALQASGLFPGFVFDRDEYVRRASPKDFFYVLRR